TRLAVSAHQLTAHVETATTTPSVAARTSSSAPYLTILYRTRFIERHLRLSRGVAAAATPRLVVRVERAQLDALRLVRARVEEPRRVGVHRGDDADHAVVLRLAPSPDGSYLRRLTRHAITAAAVVMMSSRTRTSPADQVPGMSASDQKWLSSWSADQKWLSVPSVGVGVGVGVYTVVTSRVGRAPPRPAAR